MRKTVRTSGRPEPEILGGYLRALREKAGLTQRDLATRLGRHQSFVWRVESGALQIEVTALLDFAEAVGADAAEIVVHVRDEARRMDGLKRPGQES